MSVVDSALSYAQGGDYERAISCLQAYASQAQGREGVEGLHLLALLQREQGELHLAKQAFEQALVLQADDVHVLNHYGNLMLELEDWALARAVFSSFLLQSPAPALMGLATLAYHTGQIEEAIDCCSQVIGLRGALVAQAYSNRSMLYAAQGRAVWAKRDAQAALAIEPHDLGARLNLAVAEYAAGEFEQCVTVCEQVLSVDDGVALAWLNLGQAQAQLQHYEAAVTALRRLLAIDPQQLHGYEQLAICY